MVWRCYPPSQHLAEKVHAYVRYRANGTNTRVKDLVDILLIARHAQVNAASLKAALEATFAAYNESTLPTSLPDPPPTWSASFSRMASEVGLEGYDLTVALTEARRFLEPVLQGKTQGSWLPDAQAWR